MIIESHWYTLLRPLLSRDFSFIYYYHVSSVVLDRLTASRTRACADQVPIDTVEETYPWYYEFVLRDNDHEDVFCFISRLTVLTDATAMNMSSIMSDESVYETLISCFEWNIDVINYSSDRNQMKHTDSVYISGGYGIGIQSDDNTSNLWCIWSAQEPNQSQTNICRIQRTTDNWRAWWVVGNSVVNFHKSKSRCCQFANCLSTVELTNRQCGSTREESELARN